MDCPDTYNSVDDGHGDPPMHDDEQLNLNELENKNMESGTRLCTKPTTAGVFPVLFHLKQDPRS